MHSNTGNTLRNLPDLKTAQNDLEIAERLRRDSLTKLQKILKLVHELETKKKVLQGDIATSKNRTAYYKNQLLELKTKSEITTANINKTKLEACNNNKYIEQMEEKIHNNFQINLPVNNMEMYSISQIQAAHDSLLQKKLLLEEDYIKNNIKMKKLQEILDNLKPNII